MSNIVQIKVPDIGDFKEVEVIEVLVAVGDTIKAEQSLITVESDKASMEIPASQGGVVKSITVKVGDKVAEGAVVVFGPPAFARREGVFIQVPRLGPQGVRARAERDESQLLFHVPVFSAR